jgi:hypothetical protein
MGVSNSGARNFSILKIHNGGEVAQAGISESFGRKHNIGNLCSVDVAVRIPGMGICRVIERSCGHIESGSGIGFFLNRLAASSRLAAHP